MPPLFTRSKTPPVSREKPGASSFGQCGNCGTQMMGAYCFQCGEKKFVPSDYSTVHLAEEVLGEFTHFDTKFLRTLRVLVTKPGELSRAYFHGGRSRYTKPLTLFVIINVIFFLIQPHSGLLRYKYQDYLYNPHFRAVVRTHLLETKEPEQRYAARFDANLQNQKKSLLIVSVPVLALVMEVLLIGTKRTYAEHLVFSVQVYAFQLIILPIAVFAILMPLALGVRALGWTTGPVARALNGELGITVILLTSLGIYIYKGLRRAYNAGPIRSGISAIAMAWTIALFTGVYYTLLFYATFWNIATVFSQTTRFIPS